MEGHKSCPFCGGTNIRVTEKESYLGVLERKGKASVSAQCRNCGCMLYQFQKETGTVDYGKRIEELWMKWDRRV